MQAFTAKGGNAALMTLPATPLKCAGAPLKMTFMLRDRLLKAGTLGASRIGFQSAPGNVLERWRSLDIDVECSRKLVAIDIGAHQATFATPEGERLQLPHDFIHVVPPMRAPDVVKQSDPACK